MNWEAFLKLLRQYPKLTVLGVVAIFTAGISAGSWMLHAEQCHAQSMQNEKDIQGLLEYQRREIEREQVEAEQQRKKLAYIKELCLSGKLKDVNECAKAGVRPRE
jgi:hypothetical protein